MLMDEPFGALDPVTREHIQDEFLRLHEQVRKTTLFVSHDIDEAVRMGDRVAILAKGGRLAPVRLPRTHPARSPPTTTWRVSSARTAVSRR